MIGTLNTTQKQNIAILIKRMELKGITNKFAQAGILAVVSKESNYNPAASEVSYATTDNARIRTIFAKTKGLGDIALNALKKDKKKFFDFVYNGIIGNGPNDGYLFRGRGYNQLTGRANYLAIGKMINVDLVNNPDLLSNPTIAADAVIAYMQSRVKRIYPSVDVNKFNNYNDSLIVFYDANAGSPGKYKNDVTGGYNKAKSVVSDLYDFIDKNKPEAIGGGLLTALAIGIGIAIFSK